MPSRYILKALNMSFTKTLTNWYSVHKRNLPWRATQNPYRIWLSEIILQQTQVTQGLPYYEAFVSCFSTVFDLANAHEEDVLKLWQGLGYYSRARNLHHTAKHIANDLNGVFPNTYVELLKLKGIGDYTASAIASICFNEKQAVVDGNVYRVLSRYFGIDTAINSSKGIKDFKVLAQSLLPQTNFGDYNQAIMEFGAKQCKPKSPNCLICPLQETCTALKTNTVELLPVKLKKTKLTKRYFNFLVLQASNNRTILHKRTGKGIWHNLYEFPLVETTKKLTMDVFRDNNQVKEFLNGTDFDFRLYNDKEIIHKLSHQHLYTQFWILDVNTLPEVGIAYSEINKLPVPKLIGHFIESFDF